MFSILFHKDVFLPKKFQDEVIRLEMRMSKYFLSEHFKQHLENQENEDRSHKYFENFVINTLNEMCSDSRKLIYPFEVEVSKDFHFFGKPGFFVTKYCIRLPYKVDEDLVVVIRPQWDKEKKDFDANNNMIVTAWINHSKDSHRTLDASKYCSKDRWEEIC